MLQTKECTQDLQSIMRRTRGGESGALTEVRKYLTSRKINCTLRDIEAVTLSVFESLLSISGPNSKPSSSWLLVAKIIHTKRVACEEETEANEFAQVDAALQSFIKTS
ncbi:unnamed protein product [Prunus brigantina]